MTNFRLKSKLNYTNRHELISDWYFKCEAHKIQKCPRSFHEKKWIKLIYSIKFYTYRLCMNWKGDDYLWVPNNIMFEMVHLTIWKIKYLVNCYEHTNKLNLYPRKISRYKRGREHESWIAMIHNMVIAVMCFERFKIYVLCKTTFLERLVVIDWRDSDWNFSEILKLSMLFRNRTWDHHTWDGVQFSFWLNEW